jgi:ubiquinone/menaquinone biosynthesis C-methylase UbiE
VLTEQERALEAETRAKYSGGYYQPQTISRAAHERGEDYSSRMLALKLDLIHEFCRGDVLVDLCCSTATQLTELADGRRLAVGVDFSMPFLTYGRAQARTANRQNVQGVCANARALPFKSGAIGGLYALSSLYYIPRVDEVVAEIGRVLRPGGACVLDMGNATSLNNIVCRAYPELAAPCHVTVRHMRAMIRAAGLRIVVHRAFQILPMWGDRPKWLAWCLSPRWVRLLATRRGGRMLDEWISSLPVVRHFAFRHVFVCEKV